MTQIEIIAGSKEDWPLQCWNRGSVSSPTDWASTDTLSAYVYQGQSETQVFAPTVAWYTAGGTQTGYGQAQVLLTIGSSDSGALEPNGTYTVIIWRTPTGSTQPSAVWRGTLKVLPAAGTSTQLVTPYCQLSDMLLYAPWLRDIGDVDTMQEGFYTQRLQARQWLDWLVVKQWRGGAWGVFGDASLPASQWSGWGMWRTPLPSPYLMNILAGGFVPQIGGVTITAPGSGYTTVPTVTAPAPTGTQWGNETATFLAALNGTGGVGAITVGIAGMGYPPGSTLTLSISGGGGSGATATANVSAGALMIRPQITRLTAYKAIAFVAAAQIASNNKLSSFANYFLDLVSAEFQQTVAELDINGDGLADMAIPLGRSNTIYT